MLGDDDFAKLLFAITAPQTDCEVLEIGARATVSLAKGVRRFGGRVLALDPAPARMRQELHEAGLEEWADVSGAGLHEIDDVFDVVVLHEPPGDELWPLVRERVEPGALIVSRGGHPEDPDLETVVVDGIELGVVLR